MRTGIVVEVTADRARLEAVVADRNSPQKRVWRAEIVLLTEDGSGTRNDSRLVYQHSLSSERHTVVAPVHGQGPVSCLCCGAAE